MLSKLKKFRKTKTSPPSSRFRRSPRSYQTIFSSILLVVLTIGIIGFLIFTNWNINQRRTELNLRIEALKKEIQTLEKKNQKLRAEISQSLTEGSLEKEAREKFNLKKPGEEVVTILPPEEAEGKLTKEKSLWQRILDPIRNFFGDL